MLSTLKRRVKLPRAHVRLTQSVPLLKPLTLPRTFALTLHPELLHRAQRQNDRSPKRGSKIGDGATVPSFTPFRLSTTLQSLRSTDPRQRRAKTVPRISTVWAVGDAAPVPTEILLCRLHTRQRRHISRGTNLDQPRSDYGNILGTMAHFIVEV